MYKPTGEEQTFLENYNVETFVRPSVATDIVAFSIFNEEEVNYRRLPQQYLNVLLIQRGQHPYKGSWALPGGFVQPQETVDETALRELEEETGVKDVYMEQLYTFSEVDRDPRTRVISASYMALIEALPILHATTDASRAAWFKVQYQKVGTNTETLEKGLEVKDTYELVLEAEEKTLKSTILHTRVIQRHKVVERYDILEAGDIAFDHSKIIALAIQRLRGKLEYTDVAFYLLPEYFTLTQLQKVYETILDTKLIPANFRRKVGDKVVETERMAEGGGYRNAKLFRRELGFRS